MKYTDVLVLRKKAAETSGTHTYAQYKQAAITTKLQPHQEAALKRALVNNLILAHSTGSGKTLTSIAIADAIGKPTTVLTPASLVSNYEKELRKHKKGGPPFKVLSLPTAVSRNYTIPEGNTVIVDEAHSLRNSGTAKQEYVKRQLQRAGRILALTGTPAYNQVQDWAPLVNMVSQQHLLPENEKDFKDKYVKHKTVDPGFWARLRGVTPGVTDSLKNGDVLRDKVHKYVDVFETDVEKPQRIDEVVKVPMDEKQETVYRFATKSLPLSIRWKIQNNIPPSKAEAAQMNAFLSGVRQISNTTEPYHNEGEPGTKLREAAKRLVAMKSNDPRFRALVYSNYLDSGINSYAGLLNKAHIPYAIFNGSLSRKQKQEIVDRYNAGKVPVILGSGSASEGLDLQGTKLIQILEPHFNNAKIDQVIGRGIRYKSHSHLPENERKVVVQRFLSTLNPESDWWTGRQKKDTSVDEYLTGMASKKDELIQQMRQVITGNT